MFTDEELAFLSRQGFSLEQVHDGRREGKRTRERKAKEAGKILILTSTPCRAERHRIRTRAGHCAQCKTANIGFTRRETATGYVYIAGSLRQRFIKVGVASDIWQRENQLRTERYGGASDWRILVYSIARNMQQREREISSQIRGERIYRGYIKDGYEQTATEIIRCPFSAALSAYAEVLGLLETARLEYLKKWTAYDFKTTYS
jgi:hypothetical protein